MPGRLSAALAGLVAVAATVVKGAYGGTIVAAILTVLMLASAWRYARRHPSGS